MGAIDSIGAEKFPVQSEEVGQRVDVMFHYRSPMFVGTVVRQDKEYPYRTVISLDDGRYALGDECQYRPAEDADGDK